MARLFTKFVTKSDSGLGLGLNITKSLNKAHGGKIWVRIMLKVKAQHFHLAFQFLKIEFAIRSSSLN